MEKQPQCDWAAKDLSETQDTVYVHCQSQINHEGKHVEPRELSKPQPKLGLWFRRKP